MNQGTLDEVVKDVLRATLMLVIQNTITLVTVFGFALTDVQTAAIIGFANSITTLGFLIARLLKIAHDSKPAQVQMVDAGGEPVTLATEPLTPPERPVRGPLP